MATDNSQQIQQNALAPSSASNDGSSASQFGISEQIAGDRYANARSAVKNKNRGLRFTKMIASGPVSDQQANRVGRSVDDGFGGV